MNIILHADDFGYDEDTCQATIDLFEKGILRSASIMVNMPASKIAIDYAKKHPEFSFGVHLTYVDGLSPVCNPKEIRSLVNKNGKFLLSNEVRKKSLFFKLNKQEIVKESVKQIEVLGAAGIKITHLDSHGHLHKFPSFLLALDNIAKETKINKIRRVQNLFITPHKTGVSSILNSIFGQYISNHFKSTKYFYMPANSFDTNWSNTVLSNINTLVENSTLEIGVHPGFQEEWRLNEYKDLLLFGQLLQGSSHKLINWNNI